MSGGAAPEPGADRLAARIAGLAPEQRALFERLRQVQRQAAALLRPPPIPRVSGAGGEGDWPLSLDQERFWFVEQLSANQAGLNITAASRMRGAVSVPLLAAALEIIERRHAAWRTSFPAAGDGPVQRVAPPRPRTRPAGGAPAETAAGAGAPVSSGAPAPAAGPASPRRRLSLVDLSALPAARREAEALAVVTADAAAAFELERGPLVRSRLVRLAERDHACLLTMHHMVTDWISFQIVWAEIAAIYSALAAGSVPALPEPPVQYPDFAVWQRGWLRGEVLAALTSWWREQLAGVPLVLDLPTDRPRPPLARMRGGRRSFLLDAGRSEALRAQARQNGATLFMSVLAATAALLHRDSGQERLILGANNANRNRPEIETVLGCFLTQVPFVLDLGGNPSWRELLARARQAALGAFAHQDLPFGKLVEAIQPRRDPSRPPLVQALVQVLDGSYSRVEIAGLELEPMDIHDGRARYDLMLSLTDLPAGIGGMLEFDADLFDPATAERWAERFSLQAVAVTADPDLHLADLPQLSAAARHQVLWEWNDTAQPLPAWTVPDRIAWRAAAAPEATAVAAGGVALSYGELERRAATLARRLLAAGLPPGLPEAEPRVAVALARTEEVPVAILGVWKAGGAYVPLDLAAPAERLAWMLGDAEPAAVVHRGPLPVALPPGGGVIDLDLDDSGRAPGAPGAAAPATGTDGAREAAAASTLDRGRPRETATAPSAGEGGPPHAAPVPAERLAYLIYTSGTTGRPKAVLIEHGGLAATLDSVIAMSGLGPGDRVPNLASYGFDASLVELFGALAAGAAVEIVPGDQALDPAAQVELLTRATRLFSVPSLLRRMAAAVRAAGLPRTVPRTLFPGGEAVTPETIAVLREAFPAAAIRVFYGPTETSILCMEHRVPQDGRQQEVMIGRPFPQVELRVVDRHAPGGPLAALGQPGELWVGGPGVARGYFRRAELTAERFVERDGRRFYRTGDLVRQLPARGGAMEFLGRVDLQVKVRGVRIEPGEVEAALLQNPAVKDVVVVAQPDSGGENRLVAYWVPAAAGAGEPAAAPAGPAPAPAGEPAAAAAGTPVPAPAELRAFLAARLPEALVPSVLVALGELPRGASGKVDRARLPAAAVVPVPAGEAPATPGEELVAGIWREVLGLPGVPRDANFFELGGHSLLATQAVSRLRAATGVELRVRDLFQAPTVAGLAAYLDRVASGATGGGVAAAGIGGVGGVGGIGGARSGGAAGGGIEGAALAVPPLLAVPRDQILPLSFAQERLWFLDRLAPGSAYHIPVALAAHGALALPALAAAVGGMVRRHEALRTHFAEFPAAAGWQPWPDEGGRAQVVQVIALPGGTGDWRLPLVDLTALPAAVRRDAARRLADAQVALPFDLAGGPVLRNLAVRLAPAEHVLLLVVHHIAADGWSIGVMVEEITTLYGAALAGTPPAGLPALGIQYADFAVWQRRWLSGGRLEAQLAYWRERLTGAPRLELAADRPRPAAPGFRGATRRHRVAPELAAGVRELARRGDATLFMVLLAAVQALLGRHAALRDVVLGSPIANRIRPEIEPLVGFFVNSLALRGDLSGDPAFADLVGRARREALGAYAHQDLPFERLVEELRPARQLAHNPLFSVMFGVQNAPYRPVELPGVRFSPFDLSFPVARFDLEIMVSEDEPAVAAGLAALPAAGAPLPGGGGLDLQVTWSVELFEPATVQRLLAHLDALLAAVTADPGLRLSAIPLLSAGERHQLLTEWNDTAVRLPERAGRGLAELFAEVARRRPDAIALTGEEGSLSYGELARQAAETARRLRAAGVGSETRVALLAERSPAMIAGLLGILEVGGTYVPLDPAYPGERLAFMLADSGAGLVLGQPELYPRLAAASGLAVPPAWLDLPAARPAPRLPAGVDPLTAGADVPASAGDGPERRPGHPDALAYVMYTSGSTGQPKGVGITHRAIVRLVRGGGFADLGEEQVFLQLAPVSFDASTLEIWAPLLNGGRLALFPPRPAALHEIGGAVARWGVTTLWLTAGLFHQMVEENLAGLRPLGQLLAGGDVLSPPHVARALAGLPHTVLVNGYGPTEATTFTCCARLALPAAPPRQSAAPGSPRPGSAPRNSGRSEGAAAGAGSGGGERVPIGRPIANTRVHVLGPDRELMPVGAWGELWAGGDGLARGYLGHPDLTAESFAPDPFSAPPGERLYRTGDTARRLADGRLEFGGRRDGQVKLRGIRIELGEVESVLARHPAVAAAAATVLGRRNDGLAGLPRPAVPASPAPPVPPAEGTAGETVAAVGEERRPEQLVAYVVPRLDEAGLALPTGVEMAPGAWQNVPELAAAWRLLAPELRRFLAAELPEALVPSTLVPLAALPLTANGKLDRQALPAPESAGMAAASYVAPEGPVEEVVAATTAQVLGVERTGMSDNFFALGGHSLLATQLVSRLMQEHNLPVTLEMVFDAADLRELAALIVELEMSGGGGELFGEAELPAGPAEGGE